MVFFFLFWGLVGGGGVGVVFTLPSSFSLPSKFGFNRDNKYHCGGCDGKVDALKRCCISSLPDNLIIHLKRFEFDLETMKRIKLTDHCVFPTQLNMEPYTKEGLARKEVTLPCQQFFPWPRTKTNQPTNQILGKKHRRSSATSGIVLSVRACRNTCPHRNC